MSGVTQDLRYAVRQLRKNPGFTAVAVVTLALGIGANTAIFTVVNALLLKMLPVKDPQHLVVVGDPTTPNTRSTGTPQTDVFSYPLYREFRDRNSVFTGLSAASTDHHIEVDIGQGAAAYESVSGRMVSGNYFSVLGLEAAAGRLLSDSDDTAENANPVVVLGYQYWQREFALSPSIIGSVVRLNGYPFTVIGVAPAAFDGDVVGERMAVFVPLTMQPEMVRGRQWRNSEKSSWLTLLGRLKSGIGPSQAEANLNVVFQQVLQGDYGAALSSNDRNAIRDAHIKVAAGGGGFSELRADYRIPLLLLMGMVGLVLLIACVNVANLLFARASNRSKEIAVRLAIGANRRRILQQLLAESALLALLGGITGSLLAISGVGLLLGILGSGATLPLFPDGRVLSFTLAVSLLTGILSGLVPALHTMKVRVSPALKTTTRAISASRPQFAWGKGLIVGQVALSLLLLFAAGLLVRSLKKLMQQDFGYGRDHLIVARLDPVSAGYSTGETIRRLAQRLTAGLASIPGVRAVTYSKNGLFSGSESNEDILVPGFVPSRPSDRNAMTDYVGPDYFAVVGIPILSGRGIEAQDTFTSARVAVVNEALVKRFFDGKNPLGRQFTINDPDWLDKPLIVVGVSHDAKEQGSIREAVKPRFYLAFQQTHLNQIVIEVQAHGVPSVALASVTTQIKATDPHLPVSFVRTLDSLVSESAANQIALAKLSGFFAGLALLLACVGLYGIMSYTTAGRTREIGLRIALGAQRSDVIRLILREGMLLVGVGLAIGIPLSLASSRVLHSFLFRLKGTDPLSLTGVTLLLGMVAAVAGFIPARRAAKVDPMVALRYE